MAQPRGKVKKNLCGIIIPGYFIARVQNTYKKLENLARFC